MLVTTKPLKKCPKHFMRYDIPKDFLYGDDYVIIIFFIENYSV